MLVEHIRLIKDHKILGRQFQENRTQLCEKTFQLEREVLEDEIKLCRSKQALYAHKTEFLEKLKM